MYQGSWLNMPTWSVQYIKKLYLTKVLFIQYVHIDSILNNVVAGYLSLVRHREE